MTSQTLCPVCGSEETDGFLDRPGVPVHQNLVFPNPQAALEAVRGDLQLRVCARCGFVFNAAFDLSKLSYGASYDNSQEHSTCFKDHVATMVDRLLGKEGVRDCHIVEIGCGQGSFLRTLVGARETGNSGVGFDPAYRGPSSDMDGRLRFEARYFGPDCEVESPDVVVCRHVIEHVPEPVTFLRAIRESLPEGSSARIFLETPCIEWILRNEVVWDFFYEHCSYFSEDSLRTALNEAGFDVSDARHVFGGQYLWFEAAVSKGGASRVRDRARTVELARRFAEHESGLKRSWSERLDAMRAEAGDDAKVAVWGAGAKGATFVNLIDPDHSRVDCVVDLNPNKQGCYIVGTGHPIVSYRELEERRVAAALLMNPNYMDENRALLAEAGINVKLIG